MTEKPSMDIEHGLRKIWVRYENMKFCAVFAALVSAVGLLLLRVIPPLGVLLHFISFFIAYFFYLRYMATLCPSCGERYASIWGKFIFGFLKPSRCQNCGLPAGSYSDYVKD